MRRARTHWIAPFFLLVVAACGGDTPDPKGAGGGSASAASSATSSANGGDCLTCADALEHGKIGVMVVCDPESAAWHAIIECACIGDCALPCAGTCEGGGVNVPCSTCLADAVKGCPAKLASCKTP